MIRSWRLGNATLTAVCEYYGPVHVPDILYPDMDRAVLESHRDLMEGAFWIPEIDRLVIRIQIWVLHLGDRVIVVDTGIGNHKPRRTPRAHMLNTVVMDWLAAAGATPDTVTDVLTTHLHSDHTGWHCRLDNDAWVPTFPNATYCIPKADYEYWGDLWRSGQARDDAFADSIVPVVNAGLARFVAPGDTCAGLAVTDARGHTPGMVNYWLATEAGTAVFAGDVLHHPVQIYRPDWNGIVDILPDQAQRTRAAFLAEVADRRALVLPCHFGPPHCGFVLQEGEGYRFQPSVPGALTAAAAPTPFTP